MRDFLTTLLNEPNLLVQNKKPVGPVELDTTNSIAQSLILYGAPNSISFLDMFGHPATTYATTVLAARRGGRCLTSSVQIGHFTGIEVTNTPFTLLLSFDYTSGAVPMMLGDLSTWDGWYIEISGTVVGAKVGGGAWPVSTIDMGAVAGKRLNIAAIFTSSTSRQIVCNGLVGAENTTSRDPAPSDPFYFIGSDSSTTNDALGNYYSYGLVNKALSLAEAVAWTKNPYQVVKTKGVVLPFKAPAAAGGLSPTGTIYGPLGGPLCGPI